MKTMYQRLLDDLYIAGLTGNRDELDSVFASCLEAYNNREVNTAEMGDLTRDYFAFVDGE